MTTTGRTSQTVDAQFADDFIRRLTDAWNSHTPSRVTELCHADVLWEDPFIVGGHLVGHDALGEWLLSLWRAFPDLRLESSGPSHIATDARSVMTDWTGSATMTGPLSPPGLGPTNKPITMSGVDRYWFADGKLTHVRTTTDVMSSARQIGAIPPEGSRAEKLVAAAQRLGARWQRRKR